MKPATSVLTKMFAVRESKMQLPARDHLFKASLTHEFTHRNDTWLSPPFTLAQHSLQTSIGYPSSIASKSLKRLHFVSIPDFSLESLALMWPSWKAMLPEVLPFSLAQGTASSTTSASSSSSSAPALPPRSTLATKDMIVKDLAAYKANFAWLDHTRLGNPDDPYILLSMVVGGSGKRSKVSGHVIVVDLSPDSPGIFDPNLGFLAVHRGASGEEIRWLLSLVFLAYEVTSLDTWGVR